MGNLVKMIVGSLLLAAVGYLAVELVHQFLLDARNAQG